MHGDRTKGNNRPAAQKLHSLERCLSRSCPKRWRQQTHHRYPCSSARRGYERAALTLNFIRALVKGGFADLHHPEYFDLDWVRHSPLAEEYHRMAVTISDALGFMEHVLGVRAGESDRIDFFTAHEALHLGYESAQTRRVPRRPGWFNLSTHFPW